MVKIQVGYTPSEIPARIPNWKDSYDIFHRKYRAEEYKSPKDFFCFIKQLTHNESAKIYILISFKLKWKKATK